MDAPAPYLHTLGELRLDGAHSALGSPRKALALLAYLSRCSARRARREELMALFWGDRPEARARQSLRQVLLELRQATDSSLEASGEMVVLSGVGFGFDVADFEQQLAAGSFEQAAAFWRGDFLANADDVGGEQYRVWLEGEREALRRKFAYALECLVGDAEARSCWLDAVRWAEAWCIASPYDERPHIRLLDALDRSGQRANALARHASFLVKLRRDLDLPASAELLEFADRLRTTNPERAGTHQPNAVVSWAAVDERAAISAFASAWNEVQAGGFGAVVLRGEFAARARATDSFLLSSPIGEGGRLVLSVQADATRSWSTAARLLADLRHARGLSGAEDRKLTELAALVPAIRVRFPRLPVASGHPEQQRSAISDVLEDVAAETRIIVRVDGISAADAETGALIDCIMRRRPSGVLLLLSDDTDALEASSLVHAAARSNACCLELQSAQAAPAPVRARRRRYGVGALLVIPLAVATAFAALRSENEAPVANPSRLAVLPFSLHGTDRYDYLRAGLAELLTTSLDGTTVWRTVDVNSVLALTAASQNTLDARDGRSVAERLNADLFVLGSITESAKTLRVQAALYRRSDQRLLVRAATQGTPEQLFELVDELAAHILGSAAAGTGRFARIAAVTTDSLSALKAYLDAESSLRELNVREAFDAFQRAVTIDSTFALAWYGHASAASWMLAPDLALISADNALRHAHRLSARDRLLVESLRAFLAGQSDTAERLARSVLTNYPDDIDRRMQLAEALFHFGWRRGNSARAAEPELRRVLRLEPDHRPALVHLAQITMRHGQRSEADSLLRRLIILEKGEPTAEWLGALHAALTSDREALRRRLIGLYDLGDWWLALALSDLATYASDLAAAERAALLLADAGRTNSARAIGHLARAHIELARGRWQNARTELAQLESVEPAWSLEYSALLSAVWFLPTTIEQHKTMAVKVMNWPAPAPRAGNSSGELPPWSTVHQRVHGEIKAYLTGLLQLRLGDFERAAVQAALLTGMDGALARGMGGSLRAQLLRLQGRPDAALATLEATMVEAPFESATASSFYSQSLERFLRAELLAEIGRYDEALGLLRSFSETSVLEAIYRAPAELKAAEIAEQRNQAALAIRHYRRFIEIWHDCDPELRPMVVEAQRRIDRLRVQTH